MDSPGVEVVGEVVVEGMELASGWLGTLVVRLLGVQVACWPLIVVVQG